MGGIAILMSGVTNTRIVTKNQTKKIKLKETYEYLQRVAHEPTLYDKVVMSITHSGGMISAGSNIISTFR